MSLQRRGESEDPARRGLTRRTHGDAGPKAWEAQEARTASAVPGGKLTPGSGASRRRARKSDVIGELFRAEAKNTQNTKGIRLERGDLDKIAVEARSAGQVPVLVFGIANDQGGVDDYAVFSLWQARTMMQAVEWLRAGLINEAAEAARRLP